MLCSINNCLPWHTPCPSIGFSLIISYDNSQIATLGSSVIYLMFSLSCLLIIGVTIRVNMIIEGISNLGLY